MILHFALTSDELTYPYYLAVISALKLQTVDQVMLWCFAEPKGRYWHLVKDKLVLKIVERPDLPGIRGKDPHFQYAHLKDLLEWRSLYEYGGMFCDLDTFSLKDATDLLDEKTEVVAALECEDLEKYEGCCHIGVVMAKQGSPIIKEIWDNALAAAQNPDMQWNGTAGHFSVVCKKYRDRVKFTEWGVLGGHGPNVRRWESPGGYIWDEARILHLYGKGMHEEYGKIDEKYIATSDSIFAVKVREILSAAEWNPREDVMNVHFLNTGREFPYMYYLSVMTALKAYGHNVILWVYDRPPDSKYFRALQDKVEIRIIPANEMPEFPVLHKLEGHNKRVVVFDYLIWKTIYEHGGMVMGLDSLTLDSHFELLNGRDLFAPIDEPIVYHFSMHGAIGRQGSEVVWQILEGIKSNLNKDKIGWGDSGIEPYMEVVKANVNRVSLAPFGMIGHCANGLFSDAGQLLRDDAKTIALYSSTRIPAGIMIDESYIETSQHLYSRLIRNRLNYEERHPIPDSKPIYVPPSTNSDRKRFHLLGLPHLPTNKVEALACAYSQKVIKMADMLKGLGHDVIFYGVEGSTVNCDEFVQVSTINVLQGTYGKYDWEKRCFKHAWGDKAFQEFNKNTIAEMSKRGRATDYVLIPWGGDKPVYDSLCTQDPRRNDRFFLAVEMGIGYHWTFSHLRVFESYAWMHYTYGREWTQEGKPDQDGRRYDVVIPNYFDPADFTFQEKKEEYFLYLGRIINRKGVLSAADICGRIGANLVVAGQDGGEAVGGRQIMDILKSMPHVEIFGYADLENRRKLLSGAKGLFVFTQYLGPFEGVTIEAGLSGTPVITTDWGVFNETVIHGVTGYRCRNADHLVWAAENIGNISPANCRAWAIQNFSLDPIKNRYEEYFNMIMRVKQGKEMEADPDRQELDWLRVYYPGEGG